MCWSCQWIFSIWTSKIAILVLDLVILRPGRVPCIMLFAKFACRVHRNDNRSPHWTYFFQKYSGKSYPIIGERQQMMSLDMTSPGFPHRSRSRHVTWRASLWWFTQLCRGVLVATLTQSFWRQIQNLTSGGMIEAWRAALYHVYGVTTMWAATFEERGSQSGSDLGHDVITSCS